MERTKRLGLLALLLVLWAGITASPATAGRGHSVAYRCRLVPPASAIEPSASGGRTLTVPSASQLAGTQFVDVSARGLTPGWQYSVVVSLRRNDRWDG